MNSLDDDPGPPGWAEFIVRLLLRQRDREAVTGDLLEEYIEKPFFRRKDGSEPESGISDK